MTNSIIISALTLIIGTLLYAATETIIQEINTQDQFDNFLKSNELAVVEFYNPTCPVCIAFKKKGIFEETANALPNVKFARVSSQSGSELHKKFEVQFYPTFIYFQQGNPLITNGKIVKVQGYVENPVFTRKVNEAFNSQLK